MTADEMPRVTGEKVMNFIIRTVSFAAVLEATGLAPGPALQ